MTTLILCPLLIASAWTELMPIPRRVAEMQGKPNPDALLNPIVVRESIREAPPEVADQAYRIDVGAKEVRIIAGGDAGERYARTTLEQLRRLGGSDLTCGFILDWPRYRWHGAMLDTARNYLDMESLKATLDMMARYKLNLFHWHLTEYWAWRLESKRHPELTKRGFYDPYGHRGRGLIYTQEQFREIVSFAAARGITIMPEFDLPGHSQAFREAFGFKTMRDPGVKEIVADLIDELCSLVPAKDMPFIHLGGDEVWDEWEKTDAAVLAYWSSIAQKAGRIVVNWTPGQMYESKGARAQMLWHDAENDGVTGCFDARGYYIENKDPFGLLGIAAYSSPFRDAPADATQWGAIFCGWHDAVAGLPYSRVLDQQQFFPACVLYGNLFWHGNTHYDPNFAGRRLPLADDSRLSRAREIERRTIAQRDKVLSDSTYAFHFMRQTDMRWRLTDLATGKVVATNIAQATVFPAWEKDSPENFLHSTTGTVAMETWIFSPRRQKVGAWIGMTSYDRNLGRSKAGGTPLRGNWNNFGASITLNGEPIEPPWWLQPGLKPHEFIPFVRWDYNLEEIPFTNDEWFMREPTPITLKEGWNHVRLVLPMPRGVTRYSQRWVGTFIPVAGTTARPREVEGLVYDSSPHEVE